MVISPPRKLTAAPARLSKDAPLPPPPPRRLHKRKPSSLVGPHTKTRKLIELSHHLLMMKTLTTRIHSVLDSLKMRGARSSSSGHRHRIHAIFDNESPSHSSSSSPKLQEILPPGMLGGPTYLDVKDIDRSMTTDDDQDDLLGTPVRTVRSDRADDGSPTITRVKPRSPLTINLSSPPALTTALSLGTLEYDNESVDDDDESRWSCIALDSRMSLSDDVPMTDSDKPLGVGLGVSSNPRLITFAAPLSTTVSKPSSPEIARDSTKRDTRSNLFDWSEQNLEKLSSGKSPPRPRTVHGKKDHADRGSRSVGRRAPSGLHARSQSVPVAPGMAGKREPVVTNKFGTWGVGSKGVSEDWDEDFDFGDDDGPLLNPDAVEERRLDSAVVMRIPQTIRDQQVKVVNNIGLVREFGLLIEELKTIRSRLLESGLSEMPKSDLWSEIDAMIELADREVEEPFPLKESPPTPNEFDPFEENAPESAIHTPPTQAWHTPNPRRSRSRRRSVLPYENNDVFSSPASQTTSLLLNSSPATATPPASRPRKDSEAMARSVIEALHRRKDMQDSSLALKPVPAQQKVLFDTNTLRYIVSHVQDLLKKVKVDLPLGIELENEDQKTKEPQASQPLEKLFKTVPSWPQTGLSRRLHFVEDQDEEIKDDDEMDLDTR